MNNPETRASDVEQNNSQNTVTTVTKKRKKRKSKRQKRLGLCEYFGCNLSTSSVTEDDVQMGNSLTVITPKKKSRKKKKKNKKLVATANECTMHVSPQKSLMEIIVHEPKIEAIIENVQTSNTAENSLLELNVDESKNEVIDNPKSSDIVSLQATEVNEDETEVIINLNSSNKKRKLLSKSDSDEETRKENVKKKRTDYDVIEIMDLCDNKNINCKSNDLVDRTYSSVCRTLPIQLNDSETFSVNSDIVLLNSSIEDFQNHEKCENFGDCNKNIDLEELSNFHKEEIVKIETDSSDCECSSTNSDIEFVSEDKPSNVNNSIIVIDDQEHEQLSFNRRKSGKRSRFSKVIECRQSIGMNICNTEDLRKEGLREIVIDGSNVAYGHANGKFFSVRGLVIAIEYFVKKGHKVRAFVPQYRLKHGQCSCPSLLQSLGDKSYVIFTPSREIEGRRITPYDDRFIVQYAHLRDGVIVSNDNYRDLLAEKPEWRRTIENNILMFTWVDNTLIFPEDPLGRSGPRLSDFLRFR